MNQEWDGFVDASPQGCIFQKSWWLQAVAPGQHEIIVLRKGNQIAAGMPLAWTRQGRYRMLVVPQLTQVLGILFRPSTAKPVKRAAAETEATLELIDRIPPCDCYDQRFHYRFTNWSPFLWNGYKQSTRYTFVLEDLSDPDRLWADLRESLRREIRKARRLGIAIRDDLGLEALYDLIEMTFRRQGLKVSYSRETVRRIDQACARAGARRMLFAVDKEGRIHAAGYYIWDRRTTYYLMGGGHPELRTSGGTSLLQWHAILEAARRGTMFDFEGSMVRGVQRFFQSFGAVPKAYYQIYRTNSLRLEGREWLKDYARRVVRHWRHR